MKRGHYISIGSLIAIASAGWAAYWALDERGLRPVTAAELRAHIETEFIPHVEESKCHKAEEEWMDAFKRLERERLKENPDTEKIIDLERKKAIAERDIERHCK